MSGPLNLVASSSEDGTAKAKKSLHICRGHCRGHAQRDHVMVMGGSSSEARLAGCRYEDIKAEAKKPYLLGGEQEPKCTACKLDNNWVGFSRYESNGPICPWVRSQAFDALPCLTSGKGSLTLSLLL